MANIRLGGQVQSELWVRFAKFRWGPDGDNRELTYFLIDRRETLSSFRSGEGDCVIGPYELAGWVRFVRRQAGGNIDGYFFRERKSFVDDPDGIESRAFGRSGQTGS